MRFVKSVPLALAAGLLVSMPAAAPAQQTASSEVDEDAVDPQNRIICRRIAPPTGSRIGPRRICKTQHEWDLIEQETRDTLENAGTRSRFGNE
ncbi:MAG: hypothetical protein HKN78_09135 [Sphingomonadaceae bacterium]|nr:hypothetical protein [Sphingomonadaceae bacterium]